MTTARQHIIILGGDLSGAMAAAYLGQHLPRADFKITYIQPNSVVRSSWTDTAHPSLRRFNRALKIAETEFIKTCRATFRLGEKFSGWAHADYINVFGDYGLPIDGIATHQALGELGKLSSHADMERYSLSARAVQAGKFLPPDPKGRPILADYNYGYMLDSRRYTQLLAQKAQSFGVTILSSAFKSLTSTNGDITSLTLDTGEVLNADLFIDSSGPQANLSLNHSPKAWMFWPGLSQAYRERSEAPSRHSGLAPASTNYAHAEGWALELQLQHETRQVAFSFNPQDGSTSYASGRRQTLWEGNVLSLGYAAAQVEPINGAALHMMQLDIERLVRLMPPRFKNAVERLEYNRISSDSYNRQRDLLSLRYKTNQAVGPEWAKRRNADIADTATYKLRLFTARGRIAMSDQDSHFRDEFIPLLLGNGVIPSRIDPMAAGIDREAAQSQLDQMNAIIENALNTMPSHADFIARHCAAEDFAYDQ